MKRKMNIYQIKEKVNTCTSINTNVRNKFSFRIDGTIVTDLLTQLNEKTTTYYLGWVTLKCTLKVHHWREINDVTIKKEY